MGLFDNLALGFSTALSVQNLLFCLLGVLIGTLVGVLPGISPLNTTAMLLPFTFGLAPTSAMIMLAGIFYGAQYGGSTTAILVNVPGETSAVVTCLDGYQMARQGSAGPALAIAAVASFFAGTRRDRRDRAAQRAAGRPGAQIHRPRVLQPARHGPDRRGRPGARLPVQGHRHDPGRDSRRGWSAST